MRFKPTEQNYSSYTAEDFKVWELLFNRQMNLLRANASELYLAAVHDIGFNAVEIPSFEQTNLRLAATTGWKLTVAKELVPVKEFFTLLSQRIFPATCWLRNMSELDYLEEPDMFHDVFGHAPLLTNRDYALFMESFGKLALKWLHQAEAINLLSRIYWFTIEFGLLNEQGITKIFGAGIISSVGEASHALSDHPAKWTFDIEQMLSTDYRKDVFQDQYFVIDSFSQLCNALPAVEELMTKTFAETGATILHTSTSLHMPIWQ